MYLNKLKPDYVFKLTKARLCIYFFKLSEASELHLFASQSKKAGKSDLLFPTT